jgi:hypothetical protein
MWCTDFVKAFFTFKSHTVLQYVNNCNFIYAHKKSMAFPVLIFAKLTNAEQRYSEFFPKWALNVESMGRN